MAITKLSVFKKSRIKPSSLSCELICKQSQKLIMLALFGVAVIISQNKFQQEVQMDPTLRKHGLSDVKHELKYNTLQNSMERKKRYESKKELGKGKNITKSNHRYNKDSKSMQHNNSQRTVLDTIIQFISCKKDEVCTTNGHDRNCIKFICMDQKCPNRVGCSYCFLDAHQFHAKLTTNACLKDLQELRYTVNSSRAKLKSELQQKKEEFLRKTEKQIQSIQQNFCSNLKYLLKKIQELVEYQFKQRQTVTFTKSSYISDFNSTRLQDTGIFGQDQNDLLVQRFMQSNKSNAFTPVKSDRIQKHPGSIEKQSSSMGWTKQDEQSMLVRLRRLNITYVEEYLRQQSMQLQSFQQQLQIYEDYYKELGCSLEEMFCAFKRAVPKWKNFKLNLTPPEVLEPFHSFYS